MKKRLRKKLHKGEFQQYGISLMVPVNVENIEPTLNSITDIANQYKILFCGGGLGQFILPSEE
ncbi:MAG: 50S ribosome-binding protein YggL, partial [Tannerella sp.]|nr:50S ribosome-binding protein YggL [Tannerella sp.]